MAAKVLPFTAKRADLPVLALYSGSDAERLMLSRVCASITTDLETHWQPHDLLQSILTKSSLRLAVVDWTKSTAETDQLLQDLRAAGKRRAAPLAIAVLGASRSALRHHQVDVWIPKPLNINGFREQIATCLGIRQVASEGGRLV